MQKLTIIFALILLILGFSALEGKDKAPKLSSKEQMLCNKTWKLTAMTVNIPMNWNKNEAPVTDLFANDPCMQGSTVRFNTDKTFNTNEPATTCR